MSMRCNAATSTGGRCGQRVGSGTSQCAAGHVVVTAAAATPVAGTASAEIAAADPLSTGADAWPAPPNGTGRRLSNEPFDRAAHHDWAVACHDQLWETTLPDDVTWVRRSAAAKTHIRWAGQDWVVSTSIVEPEHVIFAATPHGHVSDWNPVARAATPGDAIEALRVGDLDRHHDDEEDWDHADMASMATSDAMRAHPQRYGARPAIPAHAQPGDVVWLQNSGAYALYTVGGVDRIAGGAANLIVHAIDDDGRPAPSPSGRPHVTPGDLLRQGRYAPAGEA